MLNAQPDTYVRLKGRVIDIQTNVPLPYVHIINPRIHGGTVTDDKGLFSLKIQTADSLLIKTIGYAPHYFKLENAVVGRDTMVTIPLMAVSYNVGEVVVKGDDGLNLNLPGKKSTIPMQLRASTYNKKPPVIAALLDPVGFLGYHLSRKEKSKRKVRKAMQQEKNWDQLRRYYNPKTIKRLTKLPDNEVEDFMIFCNPHFNMDIFYAELEIKNRILQLFRLYQQKKE